MYSKRVHFVSGVLKQDKIIFQMFSICLWECMHVALLVWYVMYMAICFTLWCKYVMWCICSLCAFHFAFHFYHSSVESIMYYLSKCNLWGPHIVYFSFTQLKSMYVNIKFIYFLLLSLLLLYQSFIERSIQICSGAPYIELKSHLRRDNSNMIYYHR